VEERLPKISENELDCTAINSTETALLWQIFKNKFKVETDIFEEFKKKTNEFEVSILKLAEKTKAEIVEQLNAYKKPNSASFAPSPELLRQSGVFKTE